MAKLVEITGKALSGEWGTDDETGDGIPILRTTNFTNEGVVDYKDVVTRTITKKNIDEKYLRSGDIIIEKSGGSDKQPVGRVIYFDGPEKTYLFNNFTGLLRVKNQEAWFPKYVFYSLYGNYRRGGTRPFENKTTGLHNLKTDDYVSRYEVAETEYKKQVEVCEHLDRLYNVIKLREEEIQKLDDLIKARFVEMFGDLMFNQYNWPLVKIADISAFLKSGLSRKLSDVDIGLPVIRSGNIQNGQFIYGDVKYWYKEDPKGAKTEEYVLEDGDILINFINSVSQIGKTAVYRDVGRKCIYTTNIFRMKLNDNCNECYYNWFAMSDYYYRQLQNIIQPAVNQASFTTVNFLKLNIPLPPIELQNQFADFVNQVNKSKVEIQQALEKTQLLFDSLMQQYFG